MICEYCKIEMVYHHNASEWDCHHCARRRPKEPSTDVDMLPNPPKLIIEGIVTIEVPQTGYSIKHALRTKLRNVSDRSGSPATWRLSTTYRQHSVVETSLKSMVYGNTYHRCCQLKNIPARTIVIIKLNYGTRNKNYSTRDGTHRTHERRRNIASDTIRR